MKILNFIRSIQFIFMPSYWKMLDVYSKEVDTIILELLEKHQFKNINETHCVAELGNYLIWIENKPYGAIRLQNHKLEDFRPSRLTILKALKKLKVLEDLQNK